MKRNELGRILAAALAVVMLLSQGVFAYAGTITPYDDTDVVTDSTEDAFGEEDTGTADEDADGSGSGSETEDTDEEGRIDADRSETDDSGISADDDQDADNEPDSDANGELTADDEDTAETGDAKDPSDTTGNELPESMEVVEDTDDDGEFAEEEKERIENSEEYRKYYGGYLPLPGEESVPELDPDLTYRDIRNELKESDEIIPDAAFAETLQKAEQRAYPESYANSSKLETYLKDNYPAPRDQGSEGTCWAHSAMAMSEFYMIKHGLTDYAIPSLSAPKDIDFSELHLSYWAYVQGTPSVAGDTKDKVKYKPNYGSYNILATGGNTFFSVQTLLQKRGVAAETTAPYYKAYSVKRAGDLGADTEREDVAYLKNAYFINKKNKDLTKQIILENGAVGVSFYSYYNSWNSAYDFENNGAYYCPYSNWGTNHAVTIVGWDDDYPKNNFKSYKGGKYVKPKKNGAWLVRNSWTTTAKVNDYESYFWLSYEDKSIPGFWVFELNDPGDPEFKNSYFYDSEIHGTAHTTAKKSANIFTVAGGDGEETLRAVSFSIDSDMKNVKYTVEIYKDVDPSKGPESGELMEEATTTGTIAIGGIYTVTLEQPVALEEGENFSVVVSLSNGKSVDYETNFSSWKSIGITASVNALAKQSYIKTSKGWSDFGKSKKKNLIIHALTMDGKEGGSLTLNKDEISFTDRTGEEVQLTADVRKVNGREDTRYPVIYKSTDRSVAEVDETGLVTAVGNGEADIIARSNGRKDICHVKVEIPVWTVELSASGGKFTGRDSKGKTIYEDSISMNFLNGEHMLLDLPTRANYQLVKWEDEDSPGTYYSAEGDLEILRDMKIGAVWEMRYTTADPVCEPASGSTLKPGDRIVLSCATPNSTIRYNLNGSETPYTYAGPITVTKDMVGSLSIGAWAVRRDYKDSAIKAFNFTVVRDTEAEWGDITVEADRQQCGIDENDAPENIPSGIWIADASMSGAVPYQGFAVTFPGLRVYLGNVRLTEGKDYTVSYKNNTNVTANASFTVKGKGGLDGQASKTFAITPAEMDVTFISATMVEAYTGKVQKPVPEIRLGKYVLNGKNDYTISYYPGPIIDFDAENPGQALSGVKDIGEYVVLLKGKGNFTGEKAVRLDVVEKIPMSKVTVTGLKSELKFQTYNDLTEKVEQPIASAENPDGLKLSYDGEVLEKDVDYTISYQNNDKPGTATVLFTGKGFRFIGTVKKTFKVKGFPIKNADAVSGTFKKTMTWNPSQLENGGICQHPELTYENINLTEGTHYDLSFKGNKKAGKATLTATGKGHFEGTWKKTFTIKKFDLRNKGNNGKLYVYDLDENGNRESYGSQISYSSYYRKGTFSLSDGVYTPGGPKPKFVVVWKEDYYSEEIELRKGVDYTVSYKNKSYYGYSKYTLVTIKGKGGFTKSASASVSWSQNYLDTGAVISVADKARTTKSKGLYSKPVLKDLKTGKKLKAGTNYSKNYEYTYAEEATLANGAVRQPRDKVQASDVLMEGTTARIKVTVKGLPLQARKKIRYRWWSYYTTVYKYERYSDDENRTISAVYEVREGVINSAAVTINNGKAYEYTGSEIRPEKDEIVVKVNGRVLSEEEYEIVGYQNNVNAGTAKMILRGLGEICGEKTATFKIAKKKVSFAANDE